MNRDRAALLKELLFLILLLLLSVAFLFSPAFGQPFYYFSSDNSELYFPWFVFVNRSLHAFQIPVRNAAYLMGSSPFLARGDPTVLYPVLLILHLFFTASQDLNMAFQIFFLQQLAHYILGGVSFYLLCRKGLKLDKWPAYIGAIVYVCSGSFMARYVHPPLQYSLAWYPLVFFFYLQFLEKRQLVYAVANAACVGMLILSGHAQIVYYFLSFYVLFVGYLCLTVARNRTLFVWITSALMGVAGFCSAAVQLFPAVEYAKYSARVFPETAISTLYNSLHPLYYLTLLVPTLFGKHKEGYWGSDYPWGNWENWLYLGIFSFQLLFFSLWWKKKKLLFFFYGAAGLAALFSFGRYTMVSTYANQYMPFNEDLSWVNRITMVFHFFICGIVAIGAQVLLQEQRKRWQQLLSFFLIFLVGVALWWGHQHPDWVAVLQPAGRPPPDAQALAGALASVARSYQLYSITLFLVGLFLVLRKQYLLYLLGGILLVDILSLGVKFNPIDVAYGTPATLFQQRSDMAYIKADRSLFRVLQVGPANGAMVYGVESVGGNSTTVSRVYQDLSPFLNPTYPAVLDLANVKYILSADQPKSPRMDQFKQVYPGVWENTTVLPRAFFVPQYRLVSTAAEAMQHLVDPTFHPDETVLLTELPDGLVSGSDEMVASGTTVIDEPHYTPYALQVSVDTPRPGLVVLSELQYPGWGVMVDGKPARLLAADGSFYAVVVSAGQHTVTFVYHSASYLWGAVLSGMTWLTLMGGVLLPKARRWLLRAH